MLYTGDFSCVEDRHLMAAEAPSTIPDILISVSSPSLPPSLPLSLISSIPHDICPSTRAVMIIVLIAGGYLWYTRS